MFFLEVGEHALFLTAATNVMSLLGNEVLFKLIQ
jgi:hypothetical protein